jgi:hypothetical protein
METSNGNENLSKIKTGNLNSSPINSSSPERGDSSDVDTNMELNNGVKSINSQQFCLRWNNHQVNENTELRTILL